MMESCTLTTHVMNSVDGVPAARVALSLHRLEPPLMVWSLLSLGTTDEDGRCSGLAAREELGPGTYKLRFETGSYWESRGQTSLHPYVEVVFSISDHHQRIHLPLLMTRFSYSIYTGS
ncbi:5-hydroxyisourate hydrolase [Gasterosteus aculeatus]|uniref:5-hydroxyisourate hydrolase n=2 Tax=Gasterosteus aculeatus TaxID=69293 RepID=A0AAQ4RH93_GASAC|nr:5-hydroxyisourate hydrolase-like [Gasterosteus aculeatus aculeatus]XP_040018770.1 5-hydroxyisourate hydrolase-like [Gasterosteus aculeatus aculeatus]